MNFDKITVRFCNEWENTLRITGDSDTTLSNRFRTLRAVLNRAIANGYAKAESYPFARNAAEKHKFSIGKFNTSTRKRAINRDQIRLIDNYTPIGAYTAEDFKGKRNANAIASSKNLSEIERHTLAKHIFLFSFYVGGINFVDLAKLRWSNFNTDIEGHVRLNYIRQKTGGKFSVGLLPPAISIIEDYRAFTYTNPDSYAFPILNADVHKTEMQVNNRLHKILGKVNSDLKKIGKKVGITMPLTTYVARHSFGTVLRKSGVSDSIISQMYQHSTERTTQIYLDEFESETVDVAYHSLL